MSFTEFLDSFTQKGTFYIPKDPSQNVLRHFGCRTDEGLLLRFVEVAYLYDKTAPPQDTASRLYFDLKNSGYNVLFDAKGDARPKVYIRTKHFNRDKESPIGDLCLCEATDCFEEKVGGAQPGSGVVLGIAGWNDGCFIEVAPVAEPRREEKPALLR